MCTKKNCKRYNMMYRISRFEYIQFELAEQRLAELQRKHIQELQQAYAGIHPTRTMIDYNLGVIYSESINPADYAVYLVDLQEQHERKESYWKNKSEAYKKALHQLSPGERTKENITKKLNEIIQKQPDLQRQTYSIYQEVEKYDEYVENISDDELFSDYHDFLEDEKVIEQCIYLRDAHEMTYKNIGKELGITTDRVKRIIQQHEAQLNKQDLRVWRNSNLIPSDKRTKVDLQLDDDKFIQY